MALSVLVELRQLEFVYYCPTVESGTAPDSVKDSRVAPSCCWPACFPMMLGPVTRPVTLALTTLMSDLSGSSTPLYFVLNDE